MFINVFCLLLFTISSTYSKQTYLRPADGGSSNVYNLINSVWGASATSEMPDCSDPAFGHHVNQGMDDQLNKQVFNFAAHANIDNDRCKNFDRQRTEIRPDRGDLTGVNGEAMSHSWIFKIPVGFQPSDSFTHLHQIKAVGGKDTQPLITLTPRRQSSGNILELIYINSAEKTTKLKVVDLAQFIGAWIKVKESVTYGEEGRYSVAVSVFSTGAELLNYSNSNMQMWRSGAGYYRGKWGIYRSLKNRDQLRDEIVQFDNICIAKGQPECT